MNAQRPILSICLPTNGAVQWVLPTLESVYNQEVDLSLFEVVITDNGEDSQLGEALKHFNYPNLRYIPTKDKGFLNLVTCLQKGDGLYNKMLNHRMIIKPGMLLKMIEVIEKYKDTKPVIYFLNGSVKNLPELKECDNLNSFVYNMGYWVSWSAGIGFWDIDQSKLSQIEPNEMFPNASLLFEHRQESKYVIWNGIYGDLQDESGKGGYDLFHTFAVELYELVESLFCRRRLSKNTLISFRKRLLYMLSNLYYSEVINADKSIYSFIIKDVKSSILCHFSLVEYYKMVMRAYIKNVKNILLSGKEF